MRGQTNILQNQLQQIINAEITIEEVFPYPELLTNPNNIFSYSNLSPFVLHRSDIGTELPEQLSISQSENEKQETAKPFLLLIRITTNA